MQVESGVRHRVVPGKLGIVMVGVTLLLLAASSPAQASTTPQSLHRTAATNLLAHTQASFLTFTPWCTAFRSKSNATAWGYVNVGYFEIDVGVCFDSNNHSTIQWGPYCPSGWYVPFIRTSALNYCSWYRTSSGSIVVYGSWTAQLWLPVVGWCCDRTFTYSYGI